MRSRRGGAVNKRRDKAGQAMSGVGRGSEIRAYAAGGMRQLSKRGSARLHGQAGKGDGAAQGGGKEAGTRQRKGNLAVVLP